MEWTGSKVLHQIQVKRNCNPFEDSSHMQNHLGAGSVDLQNPCHACTNMLDYPPLPGGQYYFHYGYVPMVSQSVMCRWFLNRLCADGFSIGYVPMVSQSVMCRWFLNRLCADGLPIHFFCQKASELSNPGLSYIKFSFKSLIFSKQYCQNIWICFKYPF